MVLPYTCDGLPVYLPPAPRRPLAGPAPEPRGDAIPPDRRDVPLVGLPCTCGVTAVYSGWQAGLRGGRARLAPRSARRPEADRFGCPQPGRRPVTADPPAASHGSRGTRVLADLHPRARTGDGEPARGRSGSLPAASATEVLPEVHLGYTAGTWHTVKAELPRFFSARPHGLPESGFPEILVTGGCQETAPEPDLLSVSDPPAAGRSSPHAGFISLPGRIRHGGHPRQRPSTGAGSLPPAAPGRPDGPAAERLARRAWPGVPGARS
jgi:hypothetical protein